MNKHRISFWLSDEFMEQAKLHAIKKDVSVNIWVKDKIVSIINKNRVAPRKPINQSKPVIRTLTPESTKPCDIGQA